jgi:PadR family transcriptional regulator PadR
VEDLDFDQELTRAALPQAVLAVLSHGESHGYAIAEVLRQHGFARIKGGTLYPLLKRLEDQGFVEHIWQHDQAGPGRKQFTLTEHGRDELGRAAEAWHGMSRALAELRTTRQEKS